MNGILSSTRVYFFVFVLSFTLGVAARSVFQFPFSFSFLLLFLSFLPLSLFFVTRAKEVFLVTLCILGLVAGVTRFSIAAESGRATLIEKHLGEEMRFGALIVEEPDERDQTAKITVRAKNIFRAGEKMPIDTKILLTVSRYPEYNYGDEVTVSGRITKPKAFADENTGRTFDYPSYLSAKGIYYEMFRPSVSLAAEGRGNPVRSALFSLKKNFIQNISERIQEPESSLLSGLVVGAKQSLGSDLLDQFRRVGIIHIVVLSGYNITIIADSILKFFSFFWPLFSVALASISIVLFAIMVGGSATVVRATIMALLVILARRAGRVYDVTTALFLAGFLMLLQNPKILAFDPSFQLSFLATVGLIYFSPLFEKHLRFMPERFGIRDVAIATVSTQIFVLPALIYMMGEVSIVALPVNLLVLLFIPATMLFGFLTGLLGFLSSTLSMPFAFISGALLSYELGIADMFARLPFASVTVPEVSLLFVFFVYAIYALFIYWYYTKAIKLKAQK